MILDIGQLPQKIAEMLELIGGPPDEDESQEIFKVHAAIQNTFRQIKQDVEDYVHQMENLVNRLAMDDNDPDSRDVASLVGELIDLYKMDNLRGEGMTNADFTYIVHNNCT